MNRTWLCPPFASTDNPTQTGFRLRSYRGWGRSESIAKDLRLQIKLKIFLSKLSASLSCQLRRQTGLCKISQPEKQTIQSWLDTISHSSMDAMNMEGIIFNDLSVFEYPTTYHKTEKLCRVDQIVMLIRMINLWPIDFCRWLRFPHAILIQNFSLFDSILYEDVEVYQVDV